MEITDHWHRRLLRARPEWPLYRRGARSVMNWRRLFGAARAATAALRDRAPSDPGTAEQADGLASFHIGHRLPCHGPENSQRQSGGGFRPERICTERLPEETGPNIARSRARPR